MPEVWARCGMKMTDLSPLGPTWRWPDTAHGRQTARQAWVRRRRGLLIQRTGGRRPDRPGLEDGVDSWYSAREADGQTGLG